MILRDSDIRKVYSLPADVLDSARAIATEFEGWPSVIRGRLEEDLNLSPSLAYITEWALTENTPTKELTISVPVVGGEKIITETEAIDLLIDLACRLERIEARLNCTETV